MIDFLGIPDTGAEVLARLVDSASRIKADRRLYRTALAGRRIGLFFEKPSMRTRVSSEIAAIEMGAYPVVLGQDEVGLGTREAVRDVARVLDRYLDLLALRVFDHSVLVEIARYADAPVVNLLSDVEHPCQAVADLQTIAEHRPLDQVAVAYVGDGNNVCHSLMAGVTMLGGDMRVVCPRGFEPSERFVERGGDRLTISSDPADVEGADVVYTDVWASMGQESEEGERAEAFAAYQVDRAMFGLARPDAIFLHCLPAHRGEEVTDEVADHPRSRVFDQAENRLHAMKAILLELLG